ncbi:hypothetical protein RRG08_053421 [Elysia crispata]|uniref:Choline transporter-like protein 2 n=1 Tax=Elysia crispata TaxID=231223 RepID=A0AAE0ZFE8_9GAST|nr:hypothetical protein RRG08_053421 [Elysia crispata]
MSSKSYIPDQAEEEAASLSSGSSDDADHGSEANRSREGHLMESDKRSGGDDEDFNDLQERGAKKSMRGKKESFYYSPEESSEENLSEPGLDTIGGRILTKYGKPLPYDPSFHGPIRNRSCTDIICCVLFAACLLGTAVISIVAYVHGDPYRLVYPTDSHGNICGLGRLKNRPNLYFFDLVTCTALGTAVVTGCPTPQVCVKKCPTKNQVHFAINRSDLICVDKVDINQAPYQQMSTSQLVRRNLCASFYLESRPILGRCIPKIFSDAIDTSQSLVDSISNTTLERANGQGVTVKEIQQGTISLLKFYKLKGMVELLFNDVLNNLHLIAGCLLFGVVLAMTWIILLRWVTHVAIWLSIILFICLFGMATSLSFQKYHEVKNRNFTEKFHIQGSGHFELDYYLSQERTWQVLGYISGTILVIFLLIIIALYSRIILAANIIAEASVAISYMWCVLLWPVAPFLLQLVIFVYWISSMAFIASMGEKQFLNGTSDIIILLNRVPCDPEGNSTLNELCGFVKYGGDKYKPFLLIWMLFMLFWLINFVLALEEVTLAGAFASYYWAWDKKKDMPSFPLVSSLFRSLRYHTGSMAFGSLVIAFVQMVASVLEFIDRKLRDIENESGLPIFKHMRYCLACMERIVRYVNKNAYIVIAVHGLNFCSAARQGFLLVMRNVLRAAILDKVSDFLMFISKLLITAVTARDRCHQGAHLLYKPETGVTKVPISFISQRQVSPRCAHLLYKPETGVTKVPISFISQRQVSPSQRQVSPRCAHLLYKPETGVTKVPISFISQRQVSPRCAHLLYKPETGVTKVPISFISQRQVSPRCAHLLYKPETGVTKPETGVTKVPISFISQRQVSPRCAHLLYKPETGVTKVPISFISQRQVSPRDRCHQGAHLLYKPETGVTKVPISFISQRQVSPRCPVSFISQRQVSPRCAHLLYKPETGVTKVPISFISQRQVSPRDRCHQGARLLYKPETGVTKVPISFISQRQVSPRCPSPLQARTRHGTVAYILFQEEAPVVDEEIPELNYFLLPVMLFRTSVILVILGTYLIVDCFFDVYSMAVDTIFICFLEDIERNNGSYNRPYYMTQTRNLRTFLKNQSEVPQDYL